MPILDYTVIYPPVADAAARGAIDTTSIEAGTVLMQIDTEEWYIWTGNAWAEVAKVPSSVVSYPVLQDTITWTGGLDTLAHPLSGVLATDRVVCTFLAAPTQAAYITQAVPTADTVTITLSTANTSNDAEIAVLIFRDVP